jgi:protein-tyrosine phosphatase
LGSYLIAQNRKVLKDLNIKNILNVSDDCDNCFENELKYLQINIKDSLNTNISEHFEKSYNFIDKCKGNILVHCYQGISRSSSIIIFYLMKKFNWDYEESYKYVKESRNIISPNKNFEIQIINYFE